MTNTPKLSLQEGLRVRKAVVKAIQEAAKQKLACPVAPDIGDGLTALWIANQTVDYLNEGSSEPSGFPTAAPAAKFENPYGHGWSPYS